MKVIKSVLVGVFCAFGSFSTGNANPYDVVGGELARPVWGSD